MRSVALPSVSLLFALACAAPASDPDGGLASAPDAELESTTEALSAECQQVRECLLGTEFPRTPTDDYVGPAHCVLSNQGIPALARMCVGNRGGLACLDRRCGSGSFRPVAGTCGSLNACLTASGGLSCFSKHACGSGTTPRTIGTVARLIGQFWLRREGWKSDLVVRRGDLPFTTGDQVLVQQGSQVIVRCANGWLWEVPATGSMWRVSNVCR